MKTKITGIETLRAEKARLRSLQKEQEAALKNDLVFVKKEYLGTAIIPKLFGSIVPASVRHSKWINTPLNFIGKLFNSGKEIIDAESDSGTAAKARNIILGAAQSAIPFLLKNVLGGFIGGKRK